MDFLPLSPREDIVPKKSMSEDIAKFKSSKDTEQVDYYRSKSNKLKKIAVKNDIVMKELIKS
jgi:hypothetical protein